MDNDRIKVTGVSIISDIYCFTVLATFKILSVTYVKIVSLSYLSVF